MAQRLIEVVAPRGKGALVKPNGRRRWRKAARRWRRKQNRHNRETGAHWISDGTGRWYRRQRAFFGQRPTVSARPFSPRSLVGMTQRARKRAAWKSFSERARYHIGQRLRPCPGCLRCRSCVGCEVLTFEGDTCEDCGRETPMATESCDGSGVLPARGRG